MTVLVTIGPTQEPLDAMRLISNRSTGELGTELSLALATAGHEVIALRATGSTADPARLLEICCNVIPFTTTEDLRMNMEKLSGEKQIDAVYHAAAVSDFYYPEAGHGKIPTKQGALILTLEPTPKLLPKIRVWFPSATITGWKFEASGNREDALASGRAQIDTCHTNACVVNGPTYGDGFGVISKSGELTHLPDRQTLCAFLAERLSS